MKDDLIKAVDYGRKLGADYVEVRTQRLFKTLPRNLGFKKLLGCEPSSNFFISSDP